MHRPKFLGKFHKNDAAFLSYDAAFLSYDAAKEFGSSLRTEEPKFFSYDLRFTIYDAAFLSYDLQFTMRSYAATFGAKEFVIRRKERSAFCVLRSYKNAPPKEGEEFGTPLETDAFLRCTMRSYAATALRSFGGAKEFVGKAFGNKQKIIFFNFFAFLVPTQTLEKEEEKLARRKKKKINFFLPSCLLFHNKRRRVRP